MRKVFRMQHEPCNGMCYAPSYDGGENFESFKAMNAFKNDLPRLKKFFENLLKVHEPLCGNEKLRIAIDVDDIANIYVGSFMHFNKLETVIGDNILDTLEAIIEIALTVYETEDFKKDLVANPGQGHDVCDHGEDHDLKKFVLRETGIATENVEEFIRTLEQVA
jgi:hypothetical protein